MEPYELTSEWVAKKPHECKEQFWKITTFVLGAFLAFIIVSGVLSKSNYKCVVPVVKSQIK